MSADLKMQLPDFSNITVLVAGDLMLDRYWHGGTSRISPEAPVPVVRINEIEERAGGAGNVALNARALGCAIRLLGHCGEDEAGQSLLRLLIEAGITCDILTSRSHPTITKLRVLSRHQQLIRLDFEEALTTDHARRLSEPFQAALLEVDAVVLSDYGKGTLEDPQALIQSALRLQKPVIVDPKGSDFEKYRGATLMTPNRTEFEAVAGVCLDETDLYRRGETLRATLDLGALLITRSEEGMTLFEKGKPPFHLPAKAREVFDVTGAGDTVIAFLAAAIAADLSLQEAAIIANTAAGIVVGKLGTQTVSIDEITQGLEGPKTAHRGIVSEEDLKGFIRSAHSLGEKIVITNGCFDILHPGHVDYLQRARALGDRLVVLVNSDASVARLKGEERPINTLDHRLTMLAALECVDWVAAFEEDTPERSIDHLEPDILVKGGDYTDISHIAGHRGVLARGGEVKILPFVEGHSTTSLIRRISEGQKHPAASSPLPPATH